MHQYQVHICCYLHGNAVAEFRISALSFCRAFMLLKYSIFLCHYDFNIISVTVPKICDHWIYQSLLNIILVFFEICFLCEEAPVQFE